jgi:REP-associated tyrosine transposase
MLIPDNSYLLLATGHVSITVIMRRLLTGYAVSFDHHHRRHVHLFQNQFKPPGRYLLEVV